MVLLYADRFDDVEGMRRGLTDGRYKYIRCFSPQLPGAPYSSYALGQPSWSAWRDAAQNGRLSALHSAMWRTPQPVEMLFDTSADPWEIDNLAGNPAQAGRLAAMRARLRATMAATRDTSLVPEPMWTTLAGDKTIHEYVRSAAFDLETTLDLAFAASSSDRAYLPAFIKALGSDDAVIRYWAATACLILAKDAAPAIDALTTCLGDPQPLVRIVAAEALIAAGQPDSGKAALIAALDLPMPAECFDWLANALKRAGLGERVPTRRP
jgi:hypothetical protein